MLTNKTYDILKWIALVVLPAFGALYFGLSKIWELPYGEEIVGTISVIDTFLGALLGVSTAQYNSDKGSVTVKAYEDYDEDGSPIVEKEADDV